MPQERKLRSIEIKSMAKNKKEKIDSYNKIENRKMNKTLS
jgi:hypothetical protein